MKIFLWTDSKIPNLALMKISAWHKKNGDEVSIDQSTVHPFGANKAYVSCIFKKSLTFVEKLVRYGILTEIGGVAWNLQKVLPPEIEKMKPDYSLYPDCDYSIGYTYRGCPRKCPFCVVPKMPKDETHHLIYEFWNSEYRKIRLLNNNTFADSLWKETFKELIKENLILIEDGFDIRLLDDEKAFYLSRITFEKQIHFAFDNMQDKEAVRKGIKLLAKHGIKPRRLMFYVLSGFNTTFEQDRYRVDLLRSLGVDPFIMLYHKKSKLLNEFARWVNRYQLKKIPFEDFLKYRNYSYLLSKQGPEKQLTFAEEKK